jgi:predicted enzyme related to lactoylglutathione lyase
VIFGPQEVPGGMWIINVVDPQGSSIALVGPLG